MLSKRKIETREPPKHSSRTVNRKQRKIAEMQKRRRAVSGDR